MAYVTTVERSLGVNKKGIELVEEVRQYEFCYDIWNYILDFTDIKIKARMEEERKLFDLPYFDVTQFKVGKYVFTSPYYRASYGHIVKEQIYIITEATKKYIKMKPHDKDTDMFGNKEIRIVNPKYLILLGLNLTDLEHKIRVFEINRDIERCLLYNNYFDTRFFRIGKIITLTKTYDTLYCGTYRIEEATKESLSLIRLENWGDKIEEIGCIRTVKKVRYLRNFHFINLLSFC